MSWEAGETAISNYQQTGDLKGLFGLSIIESARLSTMASARQHSNTLFAIAPPPSGIDWRDVSGLNWVTAVRNQGTCGTCVAFATCAVLESRSRLSINDASRDIDLSEAHLFFCGAGQSCDSGWTFVPALQFCQTTGVGREDQFPYAPRNMACQSIPAIVEVDSWDIAVDHIVRVQAIAQRGPVIAGMKVYADLLFYKNGIYQHVTGSFLGLHAVAVIGYSNPGQYWIVKNSWGCDWGDKGFMRIAFGECGLDTQFPFYDPTVVYKGQ